MWRGAPLVCLLLFTTASVARAAQADLYGPIAQLTLDAIYAGSVVPGASGGITFPDGSKWLGATGYADMAQTRPLLATDQMRIASETKTFTATLILQMVGQGLLSLNDTINKWRPDLKIPGGNSITIGQLLTMRTNIPSEAGPQVLSTYVATQGKIPFTPAQYVKSSNSEPRVPVAPSQVNYSDINYDILGLIAKTAAGGSLTRMINQRIVNPVGLPGTAFLPPGSNAFTAPYSNGYGLSLADRTTIIDYTHWAPTFWADGGMLSTPADQLRWIHELMTNQPALLTPAVFAMRMATLPTVPVAVVQDYGLGLQVVRSAMTGDRLIGHAGGIQGYGSELIHADGSGLDIVVDQNVGDGPAGTPGAITSAMLLEYNLAQALAANGSCGGGTCSGVNVRLAPLTLNGTAFVVQPSGLVAYIPAVLDLSGTIGVATVVAPTLAFYGNGTSFLRLTGGSQLTVADGAIVRVTGNNSVAIDLSGTGNAVVVDGLVEAGRAPQASGQNSLALQSGAGSGAIMLSTSGRINGNVALGGSYQLQADGLLDGNVQLNGGAAVLTGGGVVTGTVSGNGTVAPGSGVLTVGSYDAAGGVLRVATGSNGNSGQLQVIAFPTATSSGYWIDTTSITGGGDGSARLGGGRLVLVPQPGPDGVFTVLTAQEVTGQFANAAAPGQRLGIAVAYGPTSVSVATVEPSLRDLTVRASGAAATGLLELISRHLRNRWSGLADTTNATAPMASGLLLASQSADARDFAALVTDAGAQPTGADGSLVVVWADGFGATEHDWPGDAPSYGITSAGALLGADVTISPDAVAGAALAYHHADGQVSGNIGRADTDAWFGSLYGSVVAGRALVDGAMLLGHGETATQRWLDAEGTTLQATGNPNDMRFAAALGASVAFDTEWARLEPHLGLQYRALWQGGYAESGAGPFDILYPASAFQALRAEALLTAKRAVALTIGATLGVLVPELRIGVAADWALGSRASEVQMAGFGDPFLLAGDTASRTVGLAGAGVSLAIGSLALRLDYDGGFDGQAVAHRVTAGLRWRW